MTAYLPADHQLYAALLQTDEAWNAAYHQADPYRLDPLVAPHWMGFLPDGTTVYRDQLLGALAELPPAELTFERHALHVFGETGITQGTLYVDGQRAQSYLRVYSWLEEGWQAMSVQLLS